MSDLLVPSRRSFLLGLASLVAAPAVIRLGGLMPIRPQVIGWDLAQGEDVTVLVWRRNELLPISIITRENIRLWKNSNEFIQNIDRQYDKVFYPSRKGGIQYHIDSLLKLSKSR